MYASLASFTCLLIACAAPLASAATTAAPGSSQSIYRDWTFNYQPASRPDLGMVAPEYDDSHWTAVALPHTWNTFETTREPHPFIHTASERDDPYWWKGWGIYRKHFRTPALGAGQRVFVEFEGVQKYARVFLNGHELGENKGGYYGFTFDLTSGVRADADNVLAVLVSNRRDDAFGGIPPMTAGNFNVYGGIYRDVHLLVKDAVHLPFQGSATEEGGTFITTPEVTRDRAVVQIQTWIRNSDAVARNARLRTRLLAPNGALIEELAEPLTLAPNATQQVVQRSQPVRQPQLWSPDHPTLYSVETLVERDGQVVDRQKNPLGFRWFRWDKPSHRLFVNDEPILIAGTNRHQEYPWLGDAMPRWLHEQDLDDIRHNLGYNFMRTAHYPQANFIYDLNDQLGIITVCEVPNIKSIAFGRDIQEANARAMVRRLRNHPAIFFWSVGNETSQAADSRWVWEEDKTRIIHQRKAEQFGDFVTHDHTDLDMENLLRCTVRGWHDEDFKDLARVHPASGQVTGTEEWQHAQSRVPNSSLRGILNEQTVTWLYADHGCDRIYPNSPLRYVNPKGWVDAYREPKYMYYLWQANWLERPMVFIQPHPWRRANLGHRFAIEVDSNADEVELFAGSRSLGVQAPNRANFHTVSFADVLVEDAPLRAEARRQGRTVATWLVPMAGAPTKLALSARYDRLLADRASVAVLRADVVDAQAQHVGGVLPTLTWTVTGPARLLTPADYSSDVRKDSADAGVWYTDLPIGTLVRTTATPGEIRVTVSAPGLASAEVVLQSLPVRDEPTAGFIEPLLVDSGRDAVRRIPGFIDKVEYVADIAPLRDSPQFGRRSAPEYRQELDRLVRGRNSSFKPRQPGYERFLGSLVGQLAAASGNLIEDDFNQLADRYNTYAHLDRVIDTLGFHPRYLAAWREHLADQLIARGQLIEMAEVTAVLRGTPTVGRWVELELKANASPATESYDHVQTISTVKADSVEHALAALDGEFAHAGSGDRAQRIALLQRFNPWWTLTVAPSHFWLPGTAAPAKLREP